MTKISMKGFIKLYDEIKKELLIITWPTKKDIIISVSVVGISIVFAGSIFFAADYFLYNAVQFLIKL